MALYCNLTEEVTIITSAKNIIKACDYLGIKHLVHKEYTGFEIIKRNKSVNQEIKYLLNVIGNNPIHFSHTQYAIFCFLLINQAKQNKQKIVFHDFEFLYDRIDNIPLINFNNLILKLQVYLIKFLYKAPIQLGISGPGIFMICMHMKFINGKYLQIIHDKETYFDDTLRVFQNIKLPVEDIDMLFIAQAFSGNVFFDEEKVRQVLTILNHPGMHIKMHPILKNTDVLKRCEHLPDFIPVEFFLKNVKRIVISLHSASLITASRFDHLKVISLLDVVGQKNDFINKVKLDMIRKSNNRILFPKSIKEFNCILRD